MLPTFTPGQKLYVRPEVRDYKPGDVVVFKSEDKTVVHRVLEVTPRGLRTRGDNNLHEDDELVQWDQVVGKVEQVDTGSEMKPVAGGNKALIVAGTRWTVRGIFTYLRPVLGQPYRWLRETRYVPRYWHPRIVELKLNKDTGEIIKYLVRGKVVATWDPNTQRLTCRKPYDLVIQPPQGDMK